MLPTVNFHSRAVFINIKKIKGDLRIVLGSYAYLRW